MKFSRSLIYSIMALASISFAEEQGVDCQTITEAVTATVQPEDRDFDAVSTRTNIVTVTHRPTVTVSADCKEVCEAQSPAAAKTITVSECPARPPKSDQPVQLQQLSTTIATAAGATTEEATTTQYVSIDHTVTMKHSSSTPAAGEPKALIKTNPPSQPEGTPSVKAITQTVSRSNSAPAPTTTDAEVDAEDEDETEEQCHSDCETVVVTVTKTHPPTQPAGTPLVKAITKAVTRSKSAPAPTTTAHGCQKDGQCHTTVVVITKTHSSTPGGPCSTDYVTQTITQGQ